MRSFKAAHWSEVQLLTVLVIGRFRGDPTPVPPEELQPELTFRIEGVQVVDVQLTL